MIGSQTENLNKGLYFVNFDSGHLSSASDASRRPSDLSRFIARSDLKTPYGQTPLWSLDGVVGYHVRLTRERSSVRTRVETFFAFFSCSHPPHDVRNLSTKFQVNRSSFEAAAVASRRAWSNLP